ncbi:hypothetical protein LUW76_38510 [Actinomadura madurae]|nr:hypothetical protein [Actinomadura madurae]MCP9983479.1 hypothetical protein [Actinomadura madurae]URM99745.1 hypothetical protein LUW76_38510 [Actinomadura madurae]
MVTTPTGTLTKKIQRQPRWASTKPPATGPTIGASPTIAPKTPKARPRSRGGKIVRIEEITWGNRSAPPSPWSTRAASRCAGEPATPHRAEAMVKTVMPTR